MADVSAAILQKQVPQVLPNDKFLLSEMCAQTLAVYEELLASERG